MNKQAKIDFETRKEALALKLMLQYPGDVEIWRKRDGTVRGVYIHHLTTLRARDLHTFAGHMELGVLDQGFHENWSIPRRRYCFIKTG